MIITSTLTSDSELTPEMLAQIERAKSLPITYDEDCPESTPEMLEQFRCAARMRNRIRATQKREA